MRYPTPPTHREPMRYPTVERAAVRRCTVNTFSANFKILIKRDVNYRHKLSYTMRNGSHAIALCPRLCHPVNAGSQSVIMNPRSLRPRTMRF